MTDNLRRCGFCESSRNLSKEHFWPKWLKAHVNNEVRTNTQFKFKVNIDAEKKVTNLNRFDLKTKQGSPDTKKTRYFCEECNNTWMSMIQVDAKGILIKLINGENLSSSDDLKSYFLTWVAMTTMTAEFTDPETIAISSEERSSFFKKRDYPEDWLIWIGKY